jgi:AmmeMemoRadiSam system protein A
MALVDEASRKSLLAIARAMARRAIGVPIPNPQSEIPAGPESLIIDGFRRGAFVTLRMNGHLRGCIGYPEADLPLVDVIERCARSAAIADPRFPPLSADEWNSVDLEVSVLGPVKRVDDIKEVIAGRHGLMVEFGRRRGLLLPQVALEWNWDVEEFASQTCTKAGLPRDAWRKGAKLFKFEAEVFGETDQ